MIHLVTFFTNQMIDTLYLTSSDLYIIRLYIIQTSYMSVIFQRAKRTRKNGLSCFIRTINTKETSNLSWMFGNYSNNLFSYRWFNWFV